MGNIVTTLRANGYDAWGTDAATRGNTGKPWWFGTRDFLAEKRTLYDNICFNPPFFRAKGAEQFIRHALSICRGKVAAFVDIRFLAGGERAAGLFAELPPTRIWIIAPRVSCPPGAYLAAGGKAGNGSSDWAWLIFDKTAPRSPYPQLGWARSDLARAA